MTTTYMMEEEHFAGAEAMLCPHVQTAQCQEEIADRLKIMKKQDETTYKCLDFRTFSTVSTINSSTTKQFGDSSFVVMEDLDDCRTKICDWFFRASDFLKVRRETIEVAMSFVDRFISNTTSHRASLVRTDRKQYQLASMAAFGLAIKLLEPFAIDCDMLAELSRGLYSSNQFQEMEFEMLSTLSWRVNPPTSVDFLRHFLSLLPSLLNCNDDDSHLIVETLLEASVFQTELAVSNCHFISTPKSILALAALRNSINVIGQSYISEMERISFLQWIARVSNCDPFSENVQAIMSQLMRTVEQEGSNFPSDCSIWQGRMVSKASRSKKATNDTCMVSYSSETSSPICVSAQNTTRETTTSETTTRETISYQMGRSMSDFEEDGDVVIMQ